MTRPADYKLYYWPGIQGRGEFIRLALEEAAAVYIDVARLPAPQGGVPAMMKLLKGGKGGKSGAILPFAPPFLKRGSLVIAQTANILAYLGPRHRLVPTDEGRRAHALQLQLTIADLVSEAHDTHHPTSVSLTYEEQRPAARKRAAAFVSERLPKFLGYFEQALTGGPYVFGRSVSYVDLSLFQVLSGLQYAFPRAMAGQARRIPKLRALGERVAGRPRIRAYLDSERRLPFNEQGIFRRYPALDAKP